MGDLRGAVKLLGKMQVPTSQRKHICLAMEQNWLNIYQLLYRRKKMDAGEGRGREGGRVF